MRAYRPVHFRARQGMNSDSDAPPAAFRAATPVPTNCLSANRVSVASVCRAVGTGRVLAPLREVQRFVERRDEPGCSMLPPEGVSTFVHIEPGDARSCARELRERGDEGLGGGAARVGLAARH